MKRCDKDKSVSGFPDVKQGDNILRSTGSYEDSIYIVCRNPVDNSSMLINLEDGGIWSSTGGLWEDSEPSDWKKVTCCFSVTDEGE